MKHALADNIIMIAELTVKEDRVDEFLDYTVDKRTYIIITSRIASGDELK